MRPIGSAISSSTVTTLIDKFSVAASEDLFHMAAFRILHVAALPFQLLCRDLIYLSDNYLYYHFASKLIHGFWRCFILKHVACL